MLKCDFCEQEDETATFDPDWDAVVCEDCLTETKEEMERYRDDLRKMSKEVDVEEL